MFKDITLIQNRQSWLYKWEKGRIFDTDTNEEFLYFHMISFKDLTTFEIPPLNKIPDSFLISEDGISDMKIVLREEQSIKYQVYCKKHFPGTTTLLKGTSAEEPFQFEEGHGRSFKDLFVERFSTNLNKIPIQLSERIIKIFQLEKMKMDVRESIRSFSHFNLRLPTKEFYQNFNHLDLDTTLFCLHGNSKTIITKWNWQIFEPTKLIGNVQLPASQFIVLLAPSFSGLIEKQVNEFCYEVLENFKSPNNLKNATESIKSSFEVLTGTDESLIIEEKVKLQFKELVWSGVLLRN